MRCNFKRLVLLSLNLLILFSVFTLAQKRAKKPSTPAKELEAAQKFHTGIVNLLDKAPILDPRPKGVLTEEKFIAAARQILENDDLSNVLDATKALEVQLEAVGPVTGEVISVPENLSVEYYRVTVTDPKQHLNTTTNSKVSLDPPATYTFICKGPSGEKRQTVSCAGGCKVKFTF